MTTGLKIKVLLALAAGLLLVVLFSLQQGRIGDLKVELAKTKQDYADEKAVRAAEALRHTDKVRELEAEHATKQQTQEDKYVEEKRILEDRRAAESAGAGRLRQQLAAATARSREPGGADPAACERDQSRLETLGGLAGEGVELLAEGQGLVRERDLQIGRLLDQIKNDRAACQAG